jgi:hypothetical protein
MQGYTNWGGLVKEFGFLFVTRSYSANCYIFIAMDASQNSSFAAKIKKGLRWGPAMLITSWERYQQEKYY